MSNVFVIDINKQPLNPVHPGRARMLLSAGKAAVYRRYPFTIILKRVVPAPVVQPLRIKIDPGSKTSGLAIINDANGALVFAAEITHRGKAIKTALDSRRRARRSRRHRHVRYRKPRFNNRRRPQGWLPPSVASRIQNIITWITRLMLLCPITAISQELVKFDTQVLEHPEISGIEYQQGTHIGYELREYLLEKWNRTCAYCGATGIPLQVEHIQCRARNGSDRVSNLTITCGPCYVKKGTQEISAFLKHDPERLAHILAHVKTPLRDAAAVNSTRWALFEQCKALRLPVECGSGGLTKYNRTRRDLPKTHWIDAACVGASTPEKISVNGVVPLLIKAYGHGCRQMCLMDAYGFPRAQAKQSKLKHGFRTGDMVRAVVPSNRKHAGVHIGRMSAKANGAFTIATAAGSVPDIGHRYCTLLQRADGYGYQQKGGCDFLPIPSTGWVPVAP